jgi:hypothetical protein
MGSRPLLDEDVRRQRIAALMRKPPIVVAAPHNPEPDPISAPVLTADPVPVIEPVLEPEPIAVEPEPAPEPEPVVAEPAQPVQREVVRLPDPKERTMPFVSEKPVVVVVGADKGGVGKTTLSRGMLDYFNAQGLPTRAFDTESPKGSLKRFFPTAEVVNLRDPDDQAKVFDTISTSQITLIDIRAGLLTDTLTLLEEVGYQDMVREGKIHSIIMHVIGSTMDSFGEIDAVSKLVVGSKHCIVLNRYNGAEFFKGIDEVARKALDLGSSIIDIPQLEPRAMELVDAAAVPFGEFEKDPKYSFMYRGKVRSWESKVFAQLDAAKLEVA